MPNVGEIETQDRECSSLLYLKCIYELSTFTHSFPKFLEHSIIIKVHLICTLVQPVLCYKAYNYGSYTFRNSLPLDNYNSGVFSL